MVLEPKGVMEPYREPRQRGGWLTIIVGALVFAGFGAVVGYAYFNGLPSIGGEPPVIRADTAPYRRAPDERGGLEVANASSSIVSVLRPQTEPPRVERVLPPETPLAVEAPEPPPTPPTAAPPPPPQAAAPPPPAAVPAPAAPTVATALPEAPSEPPSETIPPAGATPPPAPLPTAKPPRLAALEPPAEAAPARAAPVEPPAPPQRTPPPPAAQRVVAPPPAPERVPPPATRVPPQQQARVEPTAPTPPPRQLTPEPPAAAGVVRAGEVYRLQLAAVRTDGGLTQAWAQLKQRYPAALGTVGPRIERTDTTSGPLFRLQAGPFNSREAAADACGSIRGGGGQCFIVGPVAP